MRMTKSSIMLLLLLVGSTIFLGLSIPRVHAQLTEDSFTYSPGTSTEQCQTISGVSIHNQYLASENICLGLSGQAVVDNQESDPNHDFYIFTLTAVAVNGTGVGCSAPPAPGIGISSVSTSIQVPNTVGAVAFQPLTGTQSSQQVVTLSLSGYGVGISVNFLAPSQTIQQSQTQASTNTFNWAISESNSNANTIFSHDATMGVGVQVPEGTSFTANLSASITISWIYDPYNCVDHYATFSLSGTLHASPTNFGISASPSTLAFNTGSSGSTTINVQSINGFGGSVALSANSNDPNLQFAFNPTSVTPGQGGIASSTLTITDPNLCDSGTSTVNVSGQASPTGSPLTHTVPVSVTVSPTCPPDFSLAASPTSVNVQNGNSGSTTITAASINGFSGNVALTASVPAGFSATLSPMTVSLSSSGTATSTLTVSVSGSPNAGTYTVSVAGSSGTLSHSIPVSVSYSGDFSISPNSPITYACPVMAGSICYLGGVSVNSINGFTGTVVLSASPSPGLSVTLSPSSLSLSSSTTSATSSPGVSATSGGTYTFTVTGTSGSLSHTTATITILFYDFSVSLSCGSPCGYSLTQGSTVQDTLTVTSLGGFSGTVNLSVSAGGQSVSLSASSVSLSSGSQATVTVTITAGSSSGTVTITGTCVSGIGLCISPPQTHSASVYVSITAPPCGCGGGSIAYGSLITMADGSQLPVQNLRVGAKMLGYDTTTGTYTISIVNSITVVDTTNMLIIHTSDGTPFRVDANPRQTLWVKTPSGTIGWVPVTQIKVGDDLFTQNGWVPVTSIEFAPAGTHVMYDIFASTPYFADGYLDPIYKT